MRLSYATAQFESGKQMGLGIVKLRFELSKQLSNYSVALSWLQRANEERSPNLAEGSQFKNLEAFSKQEIIEERHRLHGVSVLWGEVSVTTVGQMA